jgi:hypothetical protein
MAVACTRCKRKGLGVVRELHGRNAGTKRKTEAGPRVRNNCKIIKNVFLITQYIRDSQIALTLILMNTRTQTLPLEASTKTVPTNPRADEVTTDASREIRSHKESNSRHEVLSEYKHFRR